MARIGTRGTYREVLVAFGATRITCDRCGFARDLAPSEAHDYELFFVTEFEGERLWATNRAHLDALIALLSRPSGERRLPFPDSASFEALPKWLRAHRNRDGILAALAKMAATDTPE